MHNQVAGGNYAYLESLQAMPSAAPGQSQRDQVRNGLEKLMRVSL